MGFMSLQHQDLRLLRLVAAIATLMLVGAVPHVSTRHSMSPASLDVIRPNNLGSLRMPDLASEELCASGRALSVLATSGPSSSLSEAYSPFVDSESQVRVDRRGRVAFVSLLNEAEFPDSILEFRRLDHVWRLHVSTGCLVRRNDERSCNALLFRGHKPYLQVDPPRGAQVGAQHGFARIPECSRVGTPQRWVKVTDLSPVSLFRVRHHPKLRAIQRLDGEFLVFAPLTRTSS